MNRVLVRTAGRQRLLSGLVLAALAGCAAPHPTTTAPAVSYDPKRALLPLEQIGAVDRPAASITTRPAIPLLARRYYQAGRDRFDEELWGEAIHELSRALQVQPDYVEARVLMARAALLQGNTALGRTHAEEALRLAPDDPAAHLLLGDLAWRASDLPGVIAHLRRALLCPGAEADRPETVVCHALLGLALKEEGYLAASADVLERFLGAVEKPGRHLRQHPELRQVMALYRSRAAREIGEIREQLGQVEAAIVAYRRGLGLFPDDSELQRRLARALARAGRFNEAIELARETCLRDEDHAAGLALLTSLEELGAGRQRIDDELIRLGSAAARPALLARVAQRLGERGRTSEAAAVLRRLVDLQPDEPDARLQLAAELAALRDYDGCLDQLVEVLQRRGDAYERVCAELARIVSAGLDRAALIERARAGAAKRAALKPILGRLLLLEGRSDEAASVLTDAVEADPTLGAAHAMLAEIKLERRLWEPALKSADAAIEAGVRDAAVYRVRGTACEALDDLPKAEAAFSAAIRLDRRDTASMMALVGLLDRRGETRRAIQLLEDLVARADPSHVEARESLIRAYLSAQDLKAARTHYSEMRRLGAPRQALRRVEALVTLVTDSSKSGNARLEQYRRTLRELIRDDPKDVESAMDLALSYVAGRDFEPALPVVESALAARPDFARAAELRITLLARTLEFESALTSLQSLLRDRPRHSGYLMQLGSLALDAGDFPLAIETYRKLLGRADLSARFMQFRRELVAAFAGRQEYAAAVEVCEQALRDQPQDGRWRALYLDLLRRAGRVDEGIAVLEGWILAEPKDLGARDALVDLLRDSGRQAEAVVYCAKFCALEPGSDEALRLLIQALAGARQWESALELARTVAAEPGAPAIHRRLLARVYVLARRPEEAVGAIRKMLREVSDAEAYEEALRLLVLARQWNEAEELAEKLLAPQLERLNTNRPFDELAVLTLYRQLATIYQYSGRLTRCYDTLEKILELAPDHVGVSNDLGYVWADAGLNLDRAEKLIRYAVGAEPRVSAYLDSLGWVLYKKGDFDGARKYLTHAVERADTPDSVILDHLGDAHYRRGDAEEAVRWWRQARRSAAAENRLPTPEDDEVLRRCREKIAAVKAGRAAVTAPVAATANGGP